MKNSKLLNQLNLNSRQKRISIAQLIRNVKRQVSSLNTNEDILYYLKTNMSDISDSLLSKSEKEVIYIYIVDLLKKDRITVNNRLIQILKKI